MDKIKIATYRIDVDMNLEQLIQKLTEIRDAYSGELIVYMCVNETSIGSISNVYLNNDCDVILKY